MCAQQFLLVTQADVTLNRTDAPLDGWHVSPEGIGGRLDWLAVLHFQGMPSNRVQERTLVQRDVALALHDVVLLRDGLDHIIREAVGQGLLQLP